MFPVLLARPAGAGGRGGGCQDPGCVHLPAGDSGFRLGGEVGLEGRPRGAQGLLSLSLGGWPGWVFSGFCGFVQR